MINPLFMFSGAALAAMAALLGITADKWNEHPVPGTGVELSSGSADRRAGASADKHGGEGGCRLAGQVRGRRLRTGLLDEDGRSVNRTARCR